MHTFTKMRLTFKLLQRISLEKGWLIMAHQRNVASQNCFLKKAKHRSHQLFNADIIQKLFFCRRLRSSSFTVPEAKEQGLGNEMYLDISMSKKRNTPNYSTDFFLILEIMYGIYSITISNLISQSCDTP